MNKYLNLLFISMIIFSSGCVIEDDLDYDNINNEILVSDTLTNDISELNFSVVEDEGYRIDGNVPFIYKIDNEYVLYYCGQGGILSATSDDALNFEQTNYLGFSSSIERVITCDPTIVKLDTGYRMYYKIALENSQNEESIHKISSAYSLDGFNFTEEGIRIDSELTDDNNWASVPDAIKLDDGRVRIYYVSNEIIHNHGIVSAISTDGLNFVKEDTRITGFVDPSIIKLSNETFMLLASVLPMSESNNAEGIYYFLSNDGINFSGPYELYIKSGVIDPSITKINETTFKVYYWNINGNQQTQSLTVTLN